MFKIETEREADGRWIAEIATLPGVMAYGKTYEEACLKTEILALRVIAEQLENNEAKAQAIHIEMAAA